MLRASSEDRDCLPRPEVGADAAQHLSLSEPHLDRVECQPGRAGRAFFGRGPVAPRRRVIPFPGAGQDDLERKLDRERIRRRQEPVDRAEQVPRRGGVEVRERLVDDVRPRSEHQCAGHRQQLALAPG